MTVYVYALVDPPPARLRGKGVAGERLRLLPASGWAAVVGDVASVPAPGEDALRAHDGVVGPLCARGTAVLPFRFGTVLADDGAVARAIAERARDLAPALERVRGCQQMTVRVFADEVPAPASRAMTLPAGSGPGTQYLARRRASRDPRLDALRAAVAGLVRGEREQAHDTPPLRASLYHLVPFGKATAYRRALAASRRRHALRLRVSGPFAPYAFAPEGP